MIQIKNYTGELTAHLLKSSDSHFSKLVISVTENDILPRTICLNKKQCTDLINYLTDKRKEMR